jgi:hypothetical protein
MSTRSALLVGSMPFEDEATCMRRALDALGPHLFALPDGEVGEKTPQFPRGNRFSWVMYAIDRENWQIVKDAVRGPDGMAIDYAGIQKLKPKRSPRDLPAHITLGYDRFFRTSYPIFKQLRQERGLDSLRFQLGIPTGFAMGFAFASQIDALRYTNAFNTVLAREVNAVLQEAGDDVIIQVEVPPEVYLAYLLPTPLMRLAMWPIRDLLGKITPGATVGMHLCLGDFHNEAIIHPKTLGKMVAFSDRMVESWPSAHTLAYIHYPLAEGKIAPTTDAGYYQPMRDLHLPAGTRLIAGFVHESLSLDDNRRILAAIEQARGQTVDIASSCGLGRRTPDQANQVLDLTRQLATV